MVRWFRSACHLIRKLRIERMQLWCFTSISELLYIFFNMIDMQIWHHTENKFQPLRIKAQVKIRIEIKTTITIMHNIHSRTITKKRLAVYYITRKVLLKLHDHKRSAVDSIDLCFKKWYFFKIIYVIKCLIICMLNFEYCLK